MSFGHVVFELENISPRLPVNFQNNDLLNLVQLYYDFTGKSWFVCVELNENSFCVHCRATTDLIWPVPSNLSIQAYFGSNNFETTFLITGLSMPDKVNPQFYNNHDSLNTVTNIKLLHCWL